MPRVAAELSASPNGTERDEDSSLKKRRFGLGLVAGSLFP
jgi:hypothetical protein